MQMIPFGGHCHHGPVCRMGGLIFFFSSSSFFFPCRALLCLFLVLVFVFLFGWFFCMALGYEILRAASH